jgi:hypothetical protein
MSETEEHQTAERFAPLVIKDVLARLADRSLPPTPENFAWMYRQVMHARNLPTELQYTSEIVALRHALGAFENLLIGNAWLSNRFKALTAIAQDVGRTEVDRTEHAKQILNEIVEGRQAVMLQAARLVTDTREAISELISQVAELTDCVADGRETFERAARLTEDCLDMDDVQGALRAIARDTKKLNHTLSTSDKVLDATAEQFTSNAPYLFGPPRAMLDDTRYKASGSRGFVPAKRSSIRA